MIVKYTSLPLQPTSVQHGRGQGYLTGLPTPFLSSNPFTMLQPQWDFKMHI